jgi:predicted ATPase
MRILATSREALNIQGEVPWRVPSLSYPDKSLKMDMDEALQYEAVKLFTERAETSKPGFTLNAQNESSVVHICQLVAGIPLAIELAASRTRHLSPKAILERLDGQMKILASSSRIVPERQQTLKATIDWSYDLLSEEEQRFFDRLSVFTGDFSLEAVEDVCSDDRLKKDDVLSVLSQLVDKSLVNIENQEDGSVRYRCLIPLHQYSFQKLSESGEEKKYRKRHLSYYLRIAEKAHEEQFDAELKWQNELETEHDNLIVALNWAFTHSVEEFILLPGYLAWFWRSQSQLQLAVNYLEKALSKDAGKSEAYARTLLGLGMIVFYTGDIPRSIKLLNDSLKIWRRLKNRWEEAIVLGWLGSVLSSTDQETTLEYREQSLEIARKVGKPGLINHSLIFVCQFYAHSQQYDRGMPLVEELYLSSVEHKYPFGIYASLHFKADLVLSTNNYKDAEKQYALALETGLKYGQVLYAVMDIQGVAFALSGQSRWAKSIRLDSAARTKMKAMGLKIDGLYKFWDEWIETYIERAKKEVGEELTQKYEEEGKYMGFEATVKYALDFDKD